MTKSRRCAFWGKRKDRPDTPRNRLVDAALASGEPSPSCNQCQHFRARFDEGSFMGRCAQRDDVQFQFGFCNDFEY